MNETVIHQMSKRFRGYLPVVIDVETAGFNSETDALLEIAAVTISMDEQGYLHPQDTFSCHVEPFENANLEPKALEFNGIDPFHPFRQAVNEQKALEQIFTPVRKQVKENHCKRAILVGHNAFFDLSFINAAVKRTKFKRNPFHPFSTFDTVSFAGMIYGETVLAKAAKKAGIEFDAKQAHSAIYDTQKTAELFCKMMNTWQQLATDRPWLCVDA